MDIDTTTLQKLSIADMEKILGIQDVESILLTDSDSKDRIEKNEDFSKWYEEELRELLDDRLPWS